VIYRGNQAEKVTAATTPMTPISAETIARRTAKCEPCPFNNDWRNCEHKGCKTCPGQQFRVGGLRAKIERPFETCPDGLW